MSEVYSASAGGIQVLHTLATANHPLTKTEITGRLDGATEETVKRTLTKLYRSGYVVRKQRDTGTGANPYEYAVYQPAGDSL